MANNTTVIPHIGVFSVITRLNARKGCVNCWFGRKSDLILEGAISVLL